MKRAISSVSLMMLFFITTQTFAQVKFGVKAGLNLAGMLVEDNDQTYSENFKLKHGFHTGVTAEIPVAKKFSFETGVMLSTKGFKMDEEETLGNETFKAKAKVNLYYLDVPLTAKVYIETGSIKIYGAFGPYLGIGLSGKTKTELTVMGQTEATDEKIKFGSGDDRLKRFDFGLTAGTGIELNAVQIGISYSLGLTNISNDTENGLKTKNRVIGISAGYKFGGKSKSD